MKKSEIKIEVELDENKIPEEILWSAEDGGIERKSTKAAFLSLWEQQTKETLRIDLWTKDMPMDQMKIFFHQTFASMAETYLRATDDHKMYQTIKDFCDYFKKHAIDTQTEKNNQ